MYTLTLRFDRILCVHVQKDKISPCSLNIIIQTMGFLKIALLSVSHVVGLHENSLISW